MKNYEIYFKNGLLLDKNTGKRINLKPFETYFIQSDDDNFLLENYSQINYTPKPDAEKFEALQKKHKGYLLKKIVSKDALMCFRIGLGKRFAEDVVREYLFDAIVEEDLYIKQKQGTETWTLCDCVCASHNLLEGNLGFPYQKVKANSLSQLFANVVATYFSMKRTTVCNAFKEFYLLANSEVASLHWIKENKKGNLHHLRKGIILRAKVRVMSENQKEIMQGLE